MCLICFKIFPLPPSCLINICCINKVLGACSSNRSPCFPHSPPRAPPQGCSRIETAHMKRKGVVKEDIWGIQKVWSRAHGDRHKQNYQGPTDPKISCHLRFASTVGQKYGVDGRCRFILFWNKFPREFSFVCALSHYFLFTIGVATDLSIWTWTLCVLYNQVKDEDLLGIMFESTSTRFLKSGGSPASPTVRTVLARPIRVMPLLRRCLHSRVKRNQIAQT